MPLKVTGFVNIPEDTILNKPKETEFFRDENIVIPFNYLQETRFLAKLR